MAITNTNRETVDVTLSELAEVLAIQHKIASVQARQAENDVDRKFWIGYSMGISKAYRVIETLARKVS